MKSGNHLPRLRLSVTDESIVPESLRSLLQEKVVLEKSTLLGLGLAILVSSPFVLCKSCRLQMWCCMIGKDVLSLVGYPEPIRSRFGHRWAKSNERGQKAMEELHKILVTWNRS